MFQRHVKDNKLLVSANYVREELPVRLAHRIQKFQQLPFIVGSNPFIETVYNLYWEAFETFRSIPEIKNEKENDQYCETLRSMLSAHKNVIPALVCGIQETQNHMPIRDINRFMNQTFRSRIGRRTLAEQHLLLTEGLKKNAKDLGIVQDNVRASDVIKTCIRECDSIFMDTFKQLPPKVKIEGNINATLTYIPNHLEYIIFELLKNSMQYTYEKHHSKANLPSIVVTIGKSEQQFMIRVSDQGYLYLHRRWCRK